MWKVKKNVMLLFKYLEENKEKFMKENYKDERLYC